MLRNTHKHPHANHDYTNFITLCVQKITKEWRDEEKKIITTFKII